MKKKSDTQLSRNEALHRAAALCSRNEQCESHIKNKLFDWGVNECEVSEIITQLTQQKFIDDNRFCQSFVRDKLMFNKWGRIKIKYMLQQKGIEKNKIETALQTINEDEYQQILDELLRSKMKSIKGGTSYEKGIKLFRFAASKGFENDLIFKLSPWKTEDQE